MLEQGLLVSLAELLRPDEEQADGGAVLQCRGGGERGIYPPFLLLALAPSLALRPRLQRRRRRRRTRRAIARAWAWQ